MIVSIFALSVRQWINRPWEVALSLVLPVVFFSIFAVIFGRGLQGDRTKPIAISVVDQVSDSFSIQLIKALREKEGLELLEIADSRDPRKQARDQIRRGEVKACLIIKRPANFPTGSVPTRQFRCSIDILADRSDQVAEGYVEAIVQRTLMQMTLSKAHQSIAKQLDQEMVPGGRQAIALSESVLSESVLGVHQAEGDEVLLAPAMNVTSSASDKVDSSKGQSKNVVQGTGKGSAQTKNLHGYKTGADNVSDFNADNGVVPVHVVNILGDRKTNPIISMYAAGIAVMFLLFNATSVSGVLIEERSNQTLDRLLSSTVTMDHLLLGKWFYTVFLGTIQVTVMFVWAHFVFSVNLFDHLDGFIIMTLATAMAASGFGLFMATLCKSRSQLNGISTVLLLTMSALGGSMIPRYLMSDSLQQLGWLTFNAWAIDGYDKIFWRELPVQSLAPQLAVLTLSGVFFLCIARLLAIRWESK